MSRTPIQPLEEVYNIVRQEEDLRSGAKTSEEKAENNVFAVQTKPRAWIEDKDRGQR